MPRGRPKKQASIVELQRMLNDVRSRKKKLAGERAKLQKRIDQIDQEMSLLEGSGPVGRSLTAGGRPRNKTNLPDAIEAVMRGQGKAMKVGEIVDAVRKGGYSSSSDNFRSIVNQALIKDKRFRAPTRGQYELKK